MQRRVKAPCSCPQRIWGKFELQEGAPGRWRVIWWSRTPEQQIHEQQVGESKVVSIWEPLALVGGDTKRAGLCQARRCKVEGIYGM